MAPQCCGEFCFSSRRVLYFHNNVLEFLIIALHFSEDSDGRALLICASVIRGLLSLLISHWRKCKGAMTTAYPKELDNSEAIIECMARVRVPRPCFVETVACSLVPQTYNTVCVCVCVCVCMFVCFCTFVLYVFVCAYMYLHVYVLF